MAGRGTANHEVLLDFLDEVLVACPRCGNCAMVRPREPGCGDPFAPRRVACGACGVQQDGEKPGLAIDREGLRDPYFDLPLFLQAPCCGHVLWAYNAAHLDWLESYVGATLRTRAKGEHGWSNRSLQSRLPSWMKLAKHRDEVLRAVAKLRGRLPGQATPSHQQRRGPDDA